VHFRQSRSTKSRHPEEAQCHPSKKSPENQLENVSYSLTDMPSLREPPLLSQIVWKTKSRPQGKGSRLTSNRRFEFDKRGQLFIRSHNVTLSVAAMCVSNEDCSPVTERKVL
jgi:hypothetical protein